MAQGGSTIGFGRRGSLDLYGGSGQGAGGVRQSFGRNLCFNPSFNTGPDGYYPAVSSGTIYPNSINCMVAKPPGITQFDSALLGTSCLIVGGPAYNQDFTWTYEGNSNQLWNGVTNCTALASTTSPHAGTYCLAVTASTAAAFQIGAGVDSTGGRIKVWEGRSYTCTGYVRTAVTARTAMLGLSFFDANGTIIGSTTWGATITDSTSWQALPTVTAVAPAGAVSCAPQVNWNGAATSEVHYVDDIRFYDTNAVALGGMDTTEDSYAVYYFYAQPNTTYTFSGYCRHACDYFDGTSAQVLNLNGYALRLYDPNDTTDFPNAQTTIGTTLTGGEYRSWQRHAITYTTGSTATLPLELRLYGNKTPEKGTNTGGDGLSEHVSYPWTWTAAPSVYAGSTNWNLLSAFNIGSYWDAIQIEEAAQPSAYIDGTQRGCKWTLPSNDLIFNANYIPYSATDTTSWSANANTGAGTVSAVTLGSGWDRWFSASDAGLVSGSAGPAAANNSQPYAGDYAIQLAAAANGARTRSGLVFDYHGNGWATTPQATYLFGGYEGTISMYLRSVSGDAQVVIALEDAAGTNAILASQTITLLPQWRRYMISWQNAQGSALDSSTTRIVVRQANPANAATFQMAGVLMDTAPISNSPSDNGGVSADYMPGWPVEEENDKVLPGAAQRSTFEWFSAQSHRSVRVSASDVDVDSANAGVASFTGIVDSSTISMSIIRRCMLNGIAGRDWRDIRFSNDLYMSRGASGGGSQAITLWGDPYVSGGSYGIGIHTNEMYQRVPVSAAFGWYFGGRHAPLTSSDTGTRALYLSFPSSVPTLTVPGGTLNFANIGVGGLQINGQTTFRVIDYVSVSIAVTSTGASGTASVTANWSHTFNTTPICAVNMVSGGLGKYIARAVATTTGVTITLYTGDGTTYGFTGNVVCTAIAVLV